MASPMRRSRWPPSRGGSPCSHRWLYLKMPSVWSPLRARTSSERRVCTQGSCRSGYRSFCMLMMSCRELPNMEGLKTAFLAWRISSMFGFFRPCERQERPPAPSGAVVGITAAGMGMWGPGQHQHPMAERQGWLRCIQSPSHGRWTWTADGGTDGPGQQMEPWMDLDSGWSHG